MSSTSPAAQALPPTEFGLARFLTPKWLITLLITTILVIGELRFSILGSLDRLVVSLSVCMATEALLSFALGVFSMTVLMVATYFLMGARWGPPLGAAILVVAGVLAATSIMGLIAASATSADGAANLGAIIAVILGMLGGTFFPVGQGNEFLARLSMLTPHYWFMNGLGQISGGADWTAALPSAAALLLFSLVFGLVAWVLLRRKLAR